MVLRKLFQIDGSVNGRGPVEMAWQKEGTFLAIAGSNRRVVIVDRQGKTVHQFALQGNTPCIGLEWDHTGEVLAVMQDRQSTVTLYSTHTKKVDNLETQIKDLTFMKWSRIGPQLAFGSAKGQMLIYNRETMQKVPIMGIHSKKIVSGAWNSRNKLACIGEDKVLSITDADGSSSNQIPLKGWPRTSCSRTSRPTTVLAMLRTQCASTWAASRFFWHTSITRNSLSS